MALLGCSGFSTSVSYPIRRRETNGSLPCPGIARRSGASVATTAAGSHDHGAGDYDQVEAYAPLANVLDVHGRPLAELPDIRASRHLPQTRGPLARAPRPKLGCARHRRSMFAKQVGNLSHLELSEGARPVPTTDSHFVAFSASRGWDTSKCQMTAWNASVCGVTSAASTVGITATASPRFAVY